MHNHGFNPDTMDESMKHHPDKRPPLVSLYHQEKAPRGKTFSAAEAHEIADKDGWVDTPAKFTTAKASKSQDSAGADAKRDAIVDEIVGKEIKSNRAALESAIADFEMHRPDFGAGAFDNMINETDEQLDALIAQGDKGLVAEFLKHYKLEEAPVKTGKIENMVAKAKDLRDQHNAVYAEYSEKVRALSKIKAA